MVLFLRSCSQDFSLSESAFAARTTGRSEGQSTVPGAYPPVGESGAARFLAYASLKSAYSSVEASPDMKIRAAAKRSEFAHLEQLISRVSPTITYVRI